ncbi:hypothetical protein B0H14DRAFT_2644130 [Mycena olivaceomarginata]|nr:hypothetical protein B0H14DRAFT_2644130 [Mycena olivaceomarginata]
MNQEGKSNSYKRTGRDFEREWREQKDAELQRLRSEEEKWIIELEKMKDELSEVRGIQNTTESQANIDKLEAGQKKLPAQEKKKDEEFQRLRSENDQCKSQLNRMNTELEKTEKYKELQIARSQNERNTIRISEQQDQLAKSLLSQAKEKDDELQILRLENEEYREQRCQRDRFRQGSARGTGFYGVTDNFKVRSSLSAEVMNSLSMEECDRFHVHRLCRDNRTAFIVVRHGKTNPEELVNIRTGDKGTVKRLIQMLNDYTWIQNGDIKSSGHVLGVWVEEGGGNVSNIQGTALDKAELQLRRLLRH